jgi:hypothetical protein
MKPPDKVRMAWSAFCRLVFSVAMVAGVSGTTAAQSNSGFIDFCDPTVYDNATGELQQSFGSFTDVYRYGWFPNDLTSIAYRPDQINIYRNLDTANPIGDSFPKPRKCGLNFFGQSGAVSNNRGDMWITILSPPTRGQPLTVPAALSNDCWGLTATLWFDSAGGRGHDNNKGVGVVTNFNPSTKTGLFFGVFDASNTETLRLQSFNAAPSYPSNMAPPADVAPAVTVPSIVSGGDSGGPLAYVLQLDVCSDGTNLNAIGSVRPATSTAGTCPSDKTANQTCLVFRGPLPSGVSQNGAAGIAAVAPLNPGRVYVDTYVADFRFTGTSRDPD